MALETIANTPSTPEDFLTWSQAHALHHYDCIRVAQQKFPNVTFGVYVLDPFDPEDDNSLRTWLTQHDQMHADMDTALGIASQYDLTDIFWENSGSVELWFAQNFAEHQQWGVALNLG